MNTNEREIARAERKQLLEKIAQYVIDVTRTEPGTYYVSIRQRLLAEIANIGAASEACGLVDPDEGACILPLDHAEESHWFSMGGKPCS